MSVHKLPPRTARQQIRDAAEQFDRKEHPGIHDHKVLSAAESLLFDLYHVGKKHKVAPAEWPWVADLPRACLVLAHAKSRPSETGFRSK